MAPRTHVQLPAVHVLLDLDELDRVFRGQLVVVARGPALAWLVAATTWATPGIPLDAAFASRSGRWRHRP